MLLRNLLASETENSAFVVWGSWNKPIWVLRCCMFQTCIAYRRRLLKCVGSNLTPAEAFFWCSLLSVLSYWTATCEANLSMKKWSRNNENQAEETYSSHKEICVVRILVTRKQSQFILNGGPYPLSYATDEYCINIFYFKVWKGPWHSAPTLRALVSAGLQNFCVLFSIWLKSSKKTFQLIEITQTCINCETPEGWKIAIYCKISWKHLLFWTKLCENQWGKSLVGSNKW